MKAFLALLLLIVMSVSAFAAQDMHLGVASCASTVCHGKLKPQDDRNVWLSEYRVWSGKNDRHSKAYQTLRSDESRRIAAKLGLEAAHTASECLDCHADNVPISQRGPKFQLSDGVGCEACHGGSERWIEVHAEMDASHQRNLSLGMYATEDPFSRAEMCLDCHLGTRDQFVTHRIMGAGHPRLSFELETFTNNQPAHYSVDADYRRRKLATTGFGLWLSGQIASSTRYLSLLESPLLAGAKGSGVAPEFSLHDCHSCHRSMDERRWGGARIEQGLEPGGMRLQDNHFLMLQAVLQSFAPVDARELARFTRALLLAGQQSNTEVSGVSQELRQWLDSRTPTWLDRTFSQVDIASFRKQLVLLGSKGYLADYAAAEQAFLAMESFSIYLDDFSRNESALNAVFESVQSDASFSQSAFRRACQDFLRSL